MGFTQCQLHRFDKTVKFWDVLRGLAMRGGVLLAGWFKASAHAREDEKQSVVVNVLELRPLASGPMSIGFR
jgi:hypothetical protein